MNGLHPCTLPQRAPFAAVRRVSPLCAAFCPDSECVCGAAEKAHVAPMCGQRRKTQVQYASPTQRIHATAGKILPFGRSQHRIWLVAGTPAPYQMPQIGQKPVPTFTNGGKMKKDKQFSIRIAAQDLETIRRKAAQAHMSQSDYVTACCLGKCIVILDGLKEVLRQQKAIGNNLNQLAVLANMGKVQFANLDSAAQEFSKINIALRELQEGGAAKSQSSIS